MKRKLKKKFDNIVNDLKKATEEEIRNYKEINGEIENSYEDDEISKPQEEDDKIEISESKTEKMIQRNNRSKSIFHEDKEESCSREKFGDSSFPLAQSENIFSSENRNKPMSFESDFGENDLFPNIDHNFGDDD